MERIIYKFRKPILRESSKPIEVFDSNQIKIGEFKRVYKNLLHKIIEFISTHPLLVNVEAFDVENNQICKISEKFGLDSLVKSKWGGYFETIGSFILVDKTVIKTNPRLELKNVNGETVYLVKKDFGDKRVFIEKSNGEILAEVEYDKPMPPRNITIKTILEDLSVLDIACLYYILDVRD